MIWTHVRNLSRFDVMVVGLIAFLGPGTGHGACLETWSRGLSSRIAYEGSDYQIFIPGSYDGSTAVPLVLTLHGDEGNPAGIISVFQPYWQSRNDALYLAPRAPYAEGSWWQAYAEHVAWLNGLIALVTSQYKIDLNRIYITGWSGGACLMGGYTLDYQDKFAAAGYCMGACYSGYTPPPSPECRIPSRFVVGSADFLQPQALQLSNDLQAQGHEVSYNEIPGLGHEYSEQCFAPQLDWMMSHNLCGRSAVLPSCDVSDGADDVVEVAPEVVEDAPAEDFPEAADGIFDSMPETGVEYEDDAAIDSGADPGAPPDTGAETGNPFLEGGCGCGMFR